MPPCSTDGRAVTQGAHKAPTVTAPPPCDEHPPPRRLPGSPSRLQRRPTPAQPRAASSGGKCQTVRARHGRRQRITIPPALRARRQRTAQPHAAPTNTRGDRQRRTSRDTLDTPKRRPPSTTTGHPTGHPKRARLDVAPSTPRRARRRSVTGTGPGWRAWCDSGADAANGPRQAQNAAERATAALDAIDLSGAAGDVRRCRRWGLRSDTPCVHDDPMQSRRRRARRGRCRVARATHARRRSENTPWTREHPMDASADAGRVEVRTVAPARLEPDDGGRVGRRNERNPHARLEPPCTAADSTLTGC